MDIKQHLIQAAERGNAEAQFNLGMMCENGLDDNRYFTEGSRSDAVKWFLAAAEQGLARAQVKLADIYSADANEPENDVKACGWYLLATASLVGMPRQRTQSAYERVSAQLTPGQLATAHAFARNWKPKATKAAEPPQPLVVGHAL
jgi:TPR repeat protein